CLAAASHFLTSSRNASTSIPLWVPSTISKKSLIESFAIASRSPERTVSNGLRSFNSGFAFTRSPTWFHAEDDLRVHRMLDPERAVLVEFGDALFRRHEVLARRIGGDAYEVEDRLLRRSVVPRRERRPGLGLRRSG